MTEPSPGSNAAAPFPDAASELRRELEESEASRALLLERIALLEIRDAHDKLERSALAERVAELEDRMRADCARATEAELQGRAAADAAEALRAELERAAELSRISSDELARLTTSVAELESSVAIEQQRATGAEAARRVSLAEADAAATRARRLSERVYQLTANERLARREYDALAAQAEELRRTLEGRLATAEEFRAAAESRCRTLQERAAELQRAVATAILRETADANYAGELARALDDTRAELASARAELGDTRAMFDGVVRSRSWRLTKPIRVALRALRGRNVPAVQRQE